MSGLLKFKKLKLLGKQIKKSKLELSFETDLLEKEDRCPTSRVTFEIPKANFQKRTFLSLQKRTTFNAAFNLRNDLNREL